VCSNWLCPFEPGAPKFITWCIWNRLLQKRSQWLDSNNAPISEIWFLYSYSHFNIHFITTVILFNHLRELRRGFVCRLTVATNLCWRHCLHFSSLTYHSAQRRPHTRYKLTLNIQMWNLVTGEMWVGVGGIFKEK